MSDSFFLVISTYSILNVGHTHKTTMMEGDIVARRAEVVRRQRVVAHKP